MNFRLRNTIQLSKGYRGTDNFQSFSAIADFPFQRGGASKMALAYVGEDYEDTVYDMMPITGWESVQDLKF